jgi:arylsulfatase A-like enzyme
VRELVLKQQIAKGLMPKGTKLAPRPEGMPAWDSLGQDEKRVYARQMEVFAASLSHADEQFGRILDSLETRGELDNTIVVITSDNGASAEGAYHGTHNETLS